MGAFKRLFVYIWPQWHRISLIVVSAVVVGVLFAGSVGAVLPLIKIMMGEEGLHGWVDRKIIKDRYGLDFYIPDKIDLSDPENYRMMYYLRITGVQPGCVGEESDIRQDDLIVGVGQRLTRSNRGNGVVSSALLEELATAEAGQELAIQLQRVSDQGRAEMHEVVLTSPEKPIYAEFLQKITGFVPREQTRQNARRAVGFIIVLLLLITVLRCAAKFLQNYTVRKLVQSCIANLRRDMFVHSMFLPAGFFSQRAPSDVVSRLTRDADVAFSGVNVLFGKALREPLKAFFLLVVAMAIDYKLTLVFICGAPAALFAIRKLGKKMKRATRKSLRSWARMLGKVQEVISAVKVVKVYNRQDYEQQRFSEINSRLLKQQFKIAKVDSVAGPILEILGMFAGSAGLLLALGWVYENKMQPSEFFTLLIALGVSAESLRKTSDVWNKVQRSNAAADRVFNIIDQHRQWEAPGALEIPRLTERLEFNNVTFTYPGSERPVLEKINLTVASGSNIALVGPNGSGKTTLANLIPRFYDPDSGQILIDGKDIRNASLYSLRSQIAMVTQETVTFNDTIAANIAYGRPEASHQQVVEAAKRAFADEFISELPSGYETVIGEHGVGLSGGQLQRIVIARAILKDPVILIFDEATSQVDADSEAKIHTAIEEMMTDRMTFLIAHRFSTVISAETIVVIEGGRILAEGQHDRLIRNCPLYQSLYETQLVKTD